LAERKSVEPFHKFRSARASFERLALTILDGSNIFEDADIFALLCLPLYFLSDCDERKHCLGSGVGVADRLYTGHRAHHLSPYLVQLPIDASVKIVLGEALFADSGAYGSNTAIDDQSFRTISLQLGALGLVKITYAKATNGSMGLFWQITPAGQRLMMEVRTVRAAKVSADNPKPAV
jgi:hypothetical protein